MASQPPQVAPWTHPYPSSTQIDAFRTHINRTYNLNLETFSDLHSWAIKELECFNNELWKFCGITHSQPAERVAIGLDKMWPPPQWFPGARLNYSENLLATGLASHPDAIAISACREGGTEWRHLTWRQVLDQTQLYAAALLASGVQKGDRVAAVSTNSIETALLLLATGWIGAIFASTAPDMGVTGIVERFVQIQPKILFMETKVQYNGKKLDLRPKFSDVLAQLSQKGVDPLVVDFSNQTIQGHTAIKMRAFLSVQPSRPPPTQVPFDHPIYILYSSGTTGPPKSIVHAGGRVLLQQKKEYMLSNNMTPLSTYYQYSTTGWMMWNYLLGALSCGTRIVLYDGSPLYPSPKYQVKLLEEQGVTHWGTSPKYLAALRQSGEFKAGPLTSLQLVLCAGSPLSAELYDYLYTWAPKTTALMSGSGGTDLVGTIVGGNPLVTIHGGELAAAGLGMSVEVFDGSGQNIEDSGEKGELVITRPFLSMPISFWGEGGMEKYRKAYFDDFPGVWSHGDFIQKNPVTKGYVILGRSDGVLNPGGVRFGTAEIYAVLDKFSDSIEDYIAVGQQLGADEQVLLFLKMKPRIDLDDQLRHQIASAIRSGLSPRHVPAHIIQVTDIPYTMNGKRIENLVRDAVNGRPLKVGATAVNPECLAEYRQYFNKLSPVGTKSKL
ncbi:hypothetical protein NX059_007618 [Plenodomus lindquistii]|nr:hypothetical protein NX059_007618 [Plenodomus lindquistii]